jgi:hypothetical protein
MKKAARDAAWADNLPGVLGKCLHGTVNLSENRWKRLPLVTLSRHAYPICGGGISEIIVKLTIPLWRKPLA